ncbi:MAG: hypothetical protein KC561_11670 [Myxococcales bacterium]|nr:hypothetical protein [Myxococcales bacterium]
MNARNHFQGLLVPIVSFWTLVLVACASPLDDAHLDYGGVWSSLPEESPTISLSIGLDGRVSYEKREGSSSTTLNGPISSWSGDDFVVGIGCISSKFDVSEPPNQLENGTWTMVVDGHRLTR